MFPTSLDEVFADQKRKTGTGSRPFVFRWHKLTVQNQGDSKTYNPITLNTTL